MKGSDGHHSYSAREMEKVTNAGIKGCIYFPVVKIDEDLTHLFILALIAALACIILGRTQALN